ncbi:DUF2569 domain-containing protein [Massilia pseudoviolaceinigra]|uniref:DUF2569 domain-containing protein n=1 Tax=Massilia pseudoviolaceinigra TaxID=3057165 RepID=UPI0027964062|nr:DUF2569 domain-containing protein [Massilia sp. CCM 9206]MDQ1920297.1 DUF2569 domain-containing protein [Massilia sp. CCM 9206]
MSELKKALEGLNGWLLIVVVSVLFTPLRMLYELPELYVNLFGSDHWTAMTTPGAGAYHAAWKPLIFTEVVLNCGMLVASFLLVYLFFSKKRGFPMLFIVLHVAGILFLLCEGMIIHLFMPAEPLFDASTRTDLVRALFMAVIWVPYMLMSERVEQTFVE